MKSLILNCFSLSSRKFLSIFLVFVSLFLGFLFFHSTSRLNDTFAAGNLGVQSPCDPANDQCLPGLKCQQTTVASGPIAAGEYGCFSVPSSISPNPSDPNWEDWRAQMQSFGIYPEYENGEVMLYDRDTYINRFCPSGCLFRSLGDAAVIDSVRDDVGLMFNLAVKLEQNNYNPWYTLKQHYPETTDETLNAIATITSKLNPNTVREISESSLATYINQVKVDYLGATDPARLLINYTDPIFGTRALMKIRDEGFNASRGYPDAETMFSAIQGLATVYGVSSKVVSGGIELGAKSTAYMSRIISDMRIYRQEIIQNKQVIPLRTIQERARISGWIGANPVGGLIPCTASAISSKSLAQSKNRNSNVLAVTNCVIRITSTNIGTPGEVALLNEFIAQGIRARVLSQWGNRGVVFLADEGTPNARVIKIARTGVGAEANKIALAREMEAQIIANGETVMPTFLGEVRDENDQLIGMVMSYIRGDSLDDQSTALAITVDLRFNFMQDLQRVISKVGRTWDSGPQNVMLDFDLQKLRVIDCCGTPIPGAGIDGDNRTKFYNEIIRLMNWMFINGHDKAPNLPWDEVFFVPITLQSKLFGNTYLTAFEEAFIKRKLGAPEAMQEAYNAAISAMRNFGVVISSVDNQLAPGASVVAHFTPTFNSLELSDREERDMREEWQLLPDRAYADSGLVKTAYADTHCPDTVGQVSNILTDVEQTGEIDQITIPTTIIPGRYILQLNMHKKNSNDIIACDWIEVEVKQKIAKSVTVNGQTKTIAEFQASPFNIHLPGTVGTAQNFPMPVLITYSDESTKTLNWTFNYQPPASPTPTPGSGNPPPGSAIGNIYVANLGNLESAVTSYTPDGTFVKRFGNGLGDGDGQFRSIADIAINSKGELYTVDGAKCRIQKFDTSGTFMNGFGTCGTGNGQFSSATGIAIDSNDNIYIAEANSNRIQKFDQFGTFISKFGSSGSGDGQLSGPYDIAFDSSGNIYVSELGNHRVQVFDSNGVHKSKFGSEGTGPRQFQAARGMAFDSSGNLYVVDECRVQKFSPTFVFIRQFGSCTQYPSPPDTAFQPPTGTFGGALYVAIDSSNNIYVTDNGNHRVQKYDSDGNFLSVITGSPFAYQEHISSPVGIAITKPSTSTTKTVTVKIPQYAIWIDTGIDLASGSTYTVTASGSWAPIESYGFVGPDGWTPAGKVPQMGDNFLNLTDLGTNKPDAFNLTPTDHFGGLVGYIGTPAIVTQNGPVDHPPAVGSYRGISGASIEIQNKARKVFFVGSNFSGIAIQSGRLHLNMNDDAYFATTGDNSGSITATVTGNFTVTAPPISLDPPTISNITVSYVSSNQAEITWSTGNVQTTSKVNYGKNASFDQYKEDSVPTTQHHMVFSNLSANTTYSYKIFAKNLAGIETVSEVLQFKTLRR